MNITPRRLALAAALVMAAATFAPAAWAGDPPAADSPAASKIGAPPAGKGQIIFYRTFAPGAMLGFTIREDQTNIAKVGTNSYMVYTAEPGAHAYTIQSEAADTLHIEVDAGETYYVKQTMSMGFLAGRPHLILSDEAAFLKAGGTTLRPSKWTPPADAKPADPKPN